MDNSVHSKIDEAPVLLIAALCARNKLLDLAGPTMAPYKDIIASHYGFGEESAAFVNIIKDEEFNPGHYIGHQGVKEYESLDISGDKSPLVNTFVFNPKHYPSVSGIRRLLGTEQEGKTLVLSGPADFMTKIAADCTDMVLITIDAEFHDPGEPLPDKALLNVFEEGEIIEMGVSAKGWDFVVDQYHRRPTALLNASESLYWCFKGVRQSINKGTMIGTGTGPTVKIGSIEALEPHTSSPVLYAFTDSGTRYKFRFESTDLRDSATSELESFISQTA